MARDDGFYIERKTGAEGTYAEIAQAIQDDTYTDDTSLVVGNTYYYRVRESINDVWSDYSNEASVLFSAYTQDISLTGIASGEAIGTITCDTIGDDGYYIERKTGTDGFYAVIASAVQDNSYIDDEGLVAGNTYYYRVRELVDGVWSEYSTSAFVDYISDYPQYILLAGGITSGQAVGSLTVESDIIDESITLTNIPSGEAIGSLTVVRGSVTITLSSIPSEEAIGIFSINGYYIERKTGVNGTYAVIAQGVQGNSYTDKTNLNTDTTYYYRVRELVDGVWSEYSNEASVLYSAPSQDISLIGITSEESIGTITAVSILADGYYVERRSGIAQLYISLTGIPSEEYVSTLQSTVGPVIISLTGIPSGEAIGILNAGDNSPKSISLVGIASEEAIGTIYLDFDSLYKRISLTGIPSGETFGTLNAVRGPIAFSLIGIPSEEAVGTIVSSSIIIYGEGISSISEVGELIVEVKEKKTTFIPGPEEEIKLYVLNSNLATIKNIDIFESLIWTDRYFEYGDFELYTPIQLDLLSFLQQDNFLWLKGSEHLMIIEKLEVVCDLENGDRLIVTGRSLESILNRRILWDQTILSGNFQECIQTLINDSIISPSIPERTIPNFIFKESTDPAITELTLDVQISRGGNLYEIIQILCFEKNVGFKITLSKEDQFIFELYMGTDHSFDQIENPFVIFSPEFDNLINSNYSETKSNYKTITLVEGEKKEGFPRKEVTVGEGSALSRRELYTDASDIYQVVDDVVLTDEEYLVQLEQRGAEVLSIFSFERSFDGAIDTSTAFKYGEDFFLGDIVQIVNEYGIEGKARIVEIIRSQDLSGLTVYPTYIAVD